MHFTIYGGKISSYSSIAKKKKHTHTHTHTHAHTHTHTHIFKQAVPLDSTHVNNKQGEENVW